MQDKWQIPDPPLLTDSGAPRDDALHCNDLDLVLLPGVAFDRRGGRLGHGKGYYGGRQSKWMFGAHNDIILTVKCFCRWCRFVLAPSDGAFRHDWASSAYYCCTFNATKQLTIGTIECIITNVAIAGSVSDTAARRASAVSIA